MGDNTARATLGSIRFVLYCIETNGRGDAECSGRPKKMTLGNIKKVHKIILTNRILISQGIADILKMSKSAVFSYNRPKATTLDNSKTPKSHLKRQKTPQSVDKFMASIFWNAYEMLFNEYLEKSRTINIENNVTQLVRLK